MLRCKKCGIPLDGLLGNIGKVIFRIKTSSQDSRICNKCAGEKVDKGKDKQASKTEGKKYQCQICNRMIHEEHALEHIKAEEYLMDLIRKDHPDWQHMQPTCPECVEYYRRLIKEAEI